MGEHFARSCPSKRPTNKPPTNTQSTNSAALPGSQLSSGTSAPDAGGSEAVVLRASVACLRGARRPIHCHRLVSASAALAVAEARIVV